MMLQKTKSRRRALIKYGLTAPLFAAMVIFSSATIGINKIESFKRTSATTTMAPTDLLTNIEKVTVLDSSKAQSSKATSVTKLIHEIISDVNNQSKGLSASKSAIQNNGLTKNTESLTFNGKLNADTSVILNAAKVEVMPQYPGGDRAFITWVAKNYKYPKEAIEAGVSGRLIVQFVVEKDGSLKNVKCVRDIGYGTGTEAVRVVSAAAKWKPGIQNGRPVRVQYTLPLNLQMPVKMDSEASSPYIISSYGISNPSLIIVDGKEVTMEYLKQLKPEDIEKIDVLKDKSATEKYSEKGKNGVVIITLKTKSN